jgi:hypothetical protein
MKKGIHIIARFLLTGVLGIVLFSCGNFEKEVEVKLPEFHSQLVVEAYISRNEKVMVAVMETRDYFSEATLPFVNDATVILTHGTNTYTLKKNDKPDLLNLKWFNYMLPGPNDTLQLKAGDEIQIQVSDPKGRIATAQTRWMDPVPLDSVTHSYNSQNKALLLAHFTDPAGTTYYRFRARKLNDTAEEFVPDYFSDDNIFQGQKTTFGTGYNYEKGDTVEVTLYTINRDYYDFLSTANAASSANGNPFAQPAAIKSNVKGGTGIFTVLPFQRAVYILP